LPKRIVILSAFLSPFRSGAEACAEEVALELCDRFDITIVTARMRGDLPRNDLLKGKVKIRRVGLGFGFDKWLYPFLAPFAVKKLKPDVIHAVLETFAGLALHACRMTARGAKQILTLQTTNRNFLRKHILRTPAVVTAISVALVQKAAEYGRTDVTVIPNGIHYARMRESCGDIVKIPGRVLFVGRLEQMKGIDTLLRAFSILSHSSMEPEAHLHIVGDGSERHALEKLMDELGLRVHVRFLGRLEGVALMREYGEAGVFCGLSRSEALGNVFLEAQAAGCAVVATRVGGIPEIVPDGKAGLLIAPDDAETAAGTLRALITDSATRTRMAEVGIANASRYEWSGIAARYAALYAN
jgi:glycosyltransferase involved in cell wall biosynthesis